MSDNNTIRNLRAALGILLFLSYFTGLIAVSVFGVPLKFFELPALLSQGIVLTAGIGMAWKARFLLGSENGLGLGVIFYFQLAWIIGLLIKTYRDNYIADWSSLAHIICLVGIGFVILLIESKETN